MKTAIVINSQEVCQEFAKRVWALQQSENSFDSSVVTRISAEYTTASTFKKRGCAGKSNLKAARAKRAKNRVEVSPPPTSTSVPAPAPIAPVPAAAPSTSVLAIATSAIAQPPIKNRPPRTIVQSPLYVWAVPLAKKAKELYSLIRVYDYFLTEEGELNFRGCWLSSKSKSKQKIRISKDSGFYTVLQNSAVSEKSDTLRFYAVDTRFFQSKKNKRFTRNSVTFEAFQATFSDRMIEAPTAKTSRSKRSRSSDLSRNPSSRKAPRRSSRRSKSKSSDK
jgi:hypothetical protein